MMLHKWKARILAWPMAGLVMVCCLWAFFPASTLGSDPHRAALTDSFALRGTNSAAVTVVTNYYRFGGTNHAQMRAAMKEARPWKQTFGFDAQTKWEVSSNYRLLPEAGQFRIDAVDIRTKIVVTMPWWIPGKPVPRELVDRWNKCVNGLGRHEQGHVVLGAAAGDEVKKRLLALPAFPTAREIGAAAQQAINDTLAEFRDRERRYDAVTQHGFTQGAVFPLVPGDGVAEAEVRASP